MKQEQWDIYLLQEEVLFTFRDEIWNVEYFVWESFDPSCL